jgi:hypothetical protein
MNCLVPSFQELTAQENEACARKAKILINISKDIDYPELVWVRQGPKRPSQ